MLPTLGGWVRGLQEPLYLRFTGLGNYLCLGLRTLLILGITNIISPEVGL